MLTPEQRAKIRELVAQGAAKAEIARRVKVSRASVYRHLEDAHGQEKGEAAAPAPRASGRNQSLLAHLFEVFEDLRGLNRLTVGLLPGMRELDRLFSSIALDENENQPGYDEWLKICAKIQLCLKHVDKLVHELRLDTPTFLRLYDQMLEVRVLWMRFGNSNDSVEGEEKKTLEEEKTLYEENLPSLDRIISNLKKIIIGNRQRV